MARSTAAAWSRSHPWEQSGVSQKRPALLARQPLSCACSSLQKAWQGLEPPADHAPCGRRSEQHVLEAARVQPPCSTRRFVVFVPAAHLPEENLSLQMVSELQRALLCPPPGPVSNPAALMKQASRRVHVQGLRTGKEQCDGATRSFPGAAGTSPAPPPSGPCTLRCQILSTLL